MYLPIVKKYMKNNGVLIERALPKKGELNSPIGSKVEPFTKLGVTKVSYGKLPLSKKFKIAKGKDLDTYFYTGDTLGKSGRKKVIAPFDGYLEKAQDESFLFRQEERDYWLLSGVWGEVVNFVKGHSVLLKTQTLDLHLAACTDISHAGELIVFPNPSKLLEMQYLENYAKDSFGKNIYVGNYVNEELIKRASELGVGGVIAGSTSREAMKLAKRQNIFLGSISGFGEIPTPKYIFEILKEISSRYVFLEGGRGIVRIPVPELFSPTEVRAANYTGQLRKLKKGLKVQVFEDTYFGFVGKIESIQDDGVRVILDDVSEPVIIKIPNILALE